MAVSYDKSGDPKDLRQYDDAEVKRMMNGQHGLAVAALEEVLRLRRVVKRLVNATTQGR